MTLKLQSLRSSWYEVCNDPLRYNFQLIEVTYHNYDEGGPEKPDCDTVTKNEEEEETFMIPAVFGFGAFTLVFDVDKIMSLILSRNSDEPEEEKGEKGDEKENYEETDFGEEKKLEAPPTPLVYRSRAGTGLSRAGLSTNPKMEQEVGGRERSISDLSAVKVNLFAPMENLEFNILGNTGEGRKETC